MVCLALQMQARRFYYPIIPEFLTTNWQTKL